jgi:hypothetical protein
MSVDAKSIIQRRDGTLVKGLIRFVQRLCRLSPVGEYFLLGAGLLSLLFSSVILAQKRQFWLDEVISYLAVTDPSICRVVAAVGDAMDTCPPLYCVVGWIWTFFFGASEISLRFFSSLGVSAGLASLWITLRRHYSLLPVSLGVLCVFCLSPVVLRQNSEARMYGLFLGLTGLAVSLYDLIIVKERPGWVACGMNSVIHCMLVYTHYFGLLYSVAIMLSGVMSGSLSRHSRRGLFLSILAGWLTLIPWVGAMMRQLSLAQDGYWIPVPSLTILLNVYSFGWSGYLTRIHPGLSLGASWGAVGILSVLLVFCLSKGLGTERACGFRREDDRSAKLYRPVPMHLLILAGSFLAVPPVIWICSQLTISLFVDRYMLPTILGCGIIATTFFHFLLEEPVLSKGISGRLHAVPRARGVGQAERAFAVSLVLFAIGFPLVAAFSWKEGDRHSVKEDLALHADLLIATESPHLYFPRYHYSSSPERYVLVFERGRWEDRQFAVRKRYYPHLRIADSESFEAEHAKFLYLAMNPESGGRTRWFKGTLIGNPRFRCRLVWSGGDLQMWLVERRLRPGAEEKKHTSGREGTCGHTGDVV